MGRESRNLWLMRRKMGEDTREEERDCDIVK